MDELVIGERSFESRLFGGTGKFCDFALMREALIASGTQLVTVALKRIELEGTAEDILSHLRDAPFALLPNTSGARTAKEAVLAAELAREALETDWIKVEIHPDQKYLMPDPVETLAASELMVERGFTVLPYVHADPVLCKRLEEVGTAAVMPLAAPIGSNAGLQARHFLEIIVAESTVPVVVDAGLGAPSHAAAAMELGADAVLINTALSIADDPVAACVAFKQAVEAGRLARLAGVHGERATLTAEPTSPLTAFLDEP